MGQGHLHKATDLLEGQTRELLHKGRLSLEFLAFKREDRIVLVEACQGLPVAVKSGVVVLVERLSQISIRLTLDCSGVH